MSTNFLFQKVRPFKGLCKVFVRLKFPNPERLCYETKNEQVETVIIFKQDAKDNQNMSGLSMKKLG